MKRELKDAELKGISSDGKFTHAYRAALTLATVLLYSSGYASARGQSNHYRTITAIPEVLNGDPNAKSDSEYLDTCRTKRNAAEYDSANEASDSEAQELVTFTQEFERKVMAWLKKNKPALL